MDDPLDRSPARPATAARIYDYLLGGVHNFPADREVAHQVLTGIPTARIAARSNRAFLGRAVRYLVGEGIDQFLDIGSGIPTNGNVHEIAHQLNPDARVCYVDIDPLAVAESLDVLNGHPNASAVCADLREPQVILNHSEVNRMIDLSRPVGLLVVAVLHFIPDDSVAHNAVRRLTQTMMPGSFFVSSHGAGEAGGRSAQAEMEQAYEQKASTGSARGRGLAEFDRFFDGWELVEPGLVWLSQWRPDGDVDPEVLDNPAISGGWAGVARKPGSL
jgi:hypothetical protein